MCPLFARFALSAAPRSLPELKAQGANGESEGKAPEGPAPLRTAQRNQIYGKRAPEGPWFHMSDEAA